MNRAWAASLSNIWHSTNWPMWLAIVVAAVIVIGLVVAAVRSEGSLARNAVIFFVVMAIGIVAIFSMMRGSNAPVQSASVALSAPSAASAPDRRSAAAAISSAFQAPLPASLPALSCLDGIAGESVESACEKALFASADSTAAAVSYAAAQISRLASFGNATDADTIMTPDLRALRRTIERDRYGLVAQVLMTRDGCTSTACAFFPSLTNTAQITGNMNERLYDGLVGRYASFWNAPTSSSTASNAPASALGTPGAPGRPVSGDFPSASSIPPVNIMTPEPAAQGAQSAPRQPDANAASARAAAPAAPKKSSAQKSRAQAPTSLAPGQAADDN
jgi:hypothetical protein